MEVILVLLDKSITDKLIKSFTPGNFQGLHQLCIKPSFETFNLLGVSVHKFRSIPGQVIKDMQILSEGLCTLSKLQKFYNLYPQQPWGNMMSPKGGLELLPSNICTGRQSG
jgi:hypothetical protein